MPGVILFLHGLTGNQHTWSAVPDVLKESMGPDFDVATPEYSANIQSHADMETSARQIMTLLQTIYPRHDPIYIIGHSMGGLIAREICRQLLVNGQDDALLNRIPAVITAGTPLEGARYGNWLIRKIPFISPKIHQLADPESTFDNYRVAIRAAKERKVGRPKQLHIKMEDDGVIAAHVRTKFTEDDHDVGVIPGTHTNFATARDDAKYVAEVLLTAIRNSQNSVSAPSIARSSAIESTNLPDRLLVIACSHGKREGGGRLEGPSPAAWVPQPALRQRIISKRNYVYTILKEAKLQDGFERGGNRAHQPANLNLIHGSDLGGPVNNEGIYMPAYKRYGGRMYAHISAESWDNYYKDRARTGVLIMSGLYGLLSPDEWIQNYDVHLTDTHAGNGINVRSMWLELYTYALDAYVRHAYRNRKVKLFDFLCDHHYVDAVQWHKLPREQCSVFHFASADVDDVSLLPAAGVVVNAVLNNPGILEGFEREESGNNYSITDYGVAPSGLADMTFNFESRVGISKRSSE